MSNATDNRTTEQLCKLLEERGVEYFTNDDERAYDEPARTTWDFVLCGYEMTVTATEFVDIEGKTYLEMDFHHAFTPEQAIAATLGNEREVDVDKAYVERIEPRLIEGTPTEEIRRWSVLAHSVMEVAGPSPFGMDGSSVLWLHESSLTQLLDMCDAVDAKFSEIKKVEMVGSELNPDGLPVGLTLSEDGMLLNWCGENYVKQGALGSSMLTAEQVRDVFLGNFEKAHETSYDLWEPARFNWRAIADELNATLGGGECESSKERLQKILDEMKKLARDGRREWCGRSHGEFGIFDTLGDFAEAIERRIDAPYMWR